MSNENHLSEFARHQMCLIARRMFTIQLLAIVGGYVGVTFWLNDIRETAPQWWVWVLIIIQFLLYFSIFSACYQRAKDIGSKYSHIVVFIILAVLGRINDWEVVVIPLTVVTILVLSRRPIHKTPIST